MIPLRLLQRRGAVGIGGVYLLNKGTDEIEATRVQQQ